MRASVTNIIISWHHGFLLKSKPQYLALAFGLSPGQRTHPVTTEPTLALWLHRDGHLAGPENSIMNLVPLRQFADDGTFGMLGAGLLEHCVVVVGVEWFAQRREGLDAVLGQD